MVTKATKLSPVGEVRGSVNPAPVPFFINRDLSLLEFFRRVLDEALDPSMPLLERLKFVAIFSSNMDEFFMIRVAALREKAESEAGVSPDGWTTPELLAEIRAKVIEMVNVQLGTLAKEILPELDRNGVSVVAYESLSEDDKRQLNRFFKKSVYPLITPQAVDPTHPFPYISGGSINLGLVAKPKLNRRISHVLKRKGDDLFIRVQLPQAAPRLVPVEGKPGVFVPLEDLTIANIKRLIPEASPAKCHLFRITRAADINLREHEAEDFVETMQQNLKLRRFGEVVRLEVSKSMPREMVDYLTDSLEITADDIYTIDGFLDASAFFALCDLNRPDLKDAPLRPTKPAVLDSKKSPFEVIKEQDILLHHPYMPYTVVTDFLREAVEDPNVLAIKMCLYRIGSESPIAPLLIEASERGKEVTALVEIKARFDEANNIEWAKRLEEAGVHVVYGILGLKTHAKTTLIVRREEEGRLVRYVHIATGNYNPETSAFYTDLGLLTANEDIGEDATELFNYLTVYGKRDKFKSLLVAPIDLRDKMVEMINREIKHAEAGRKARIIAKMNRLADNEIVQALYRASQAGVRVDLIVRGICTLRPGVPGLSENISVRSIVGPLLEHSRVYYFENGGKAEIYTGSSDWMPRNLDRRVEVLAPVEDPALKKFLREEYLDAYLKDNVKARLLQPDGTYVRVEPEPGEQEFNSQMAFQEFSNVVQFSGIKAEAGQ